MKHFLIVSLVCSLATFSRLSSAQNIDSEMTLKNELAFKHLSGLGPALLECRLPDNGALKCAANEKLASIRCQDASRSPPRELKSYIQDQAFACDTLKSDQRRANVWKIELTGVDGTQSDWLVEGVRVSQATKVLEAEMITQSQGLDHAWVDGYELGIFLSQMNASTQTQQPIEVQALGLASGWEGRVTGIKTIDGRGNIPETFSLGTGYYSFGFKRLSFGPGVSANWVGRSGQKHFGPALDLKIRIELMSWLRLDLSADSFWPKVAELKRSYGASAAARFGPFFGGLVSELGWVYRDERWNDTEHWTNNGTGPRVGLEWVHY